LLRNCAWNSRPSQGKDHVDERRKPLFIVLDTGFSREMTNSALRNRIFDRAQETGQPSTYQPGLPDLEKSKREKEEFYGRDESDRVGLTVCLLPKIAVQARQSPVQ
jgi:hypothetical protein